MVRLKDVSITVRFISSIRTDQFSLQKLPGEGEHKLSRKSHKEHFIFDKPTFALQPFCCLFSFQFYTYLRQLYYSILILYAQNKRFE